MKKEFLNAAYENDVNKMHSFLDLGVDVDSENDDGVTALYRAVSKRNYEAVELLLQNTADTSKQYHRNKYTVLHIAVADNDERMVELLLRHMDDVNTRDRFGNTALWSAVYEANLITGNTAIVEMLLRKGADPYTPNNVGQMIVGKNNKPVRQSLSPYDSAVLSKLDTVLSLIEKYAPKST